MLRQELPQISFRISVPQFSSLTYLDDNSFHIFFKSPIRKTYNQTQIQLPLCLAYSVNVSYTQVNAMHESIAKAQVKGNVRKAVNSQIEFEQHSLRELERGGDISGRKKIERFVQGALDTYTSLEIGRWSKRRSSSWHSQHLQMYFNPDSIPPLNTTPVNFKANISG